MTIQARINLRNCPFLARLLQDGETLEDLLKLTPEQILLRGVAAEQSFDTLLRT